MFKNHGNNLIASSIVKVKLKLTKDISLYGVLQFNVLHKNQKQSPRYNIFN